MIYPCTSTRKNIIAFLFGTLTLSNIAITPKSSDSKLDPQEFNVFIEKMQKVTAIMERCNKSEKTYNAPIDCLKAGHKEENIHFFLDEENEEDNSAKEYPLEETAVQIFEMVIVGALNVNRLSEALEQKDIQPENKAPLKNLIEAISNLAIAQLDTLNIYAEEYEEQSKNNQK